MNLYTYPVQSKDVQFNQTQTTMVTAALTLQAKARTQGALHVQGEGEEPDQGDQVAISPEAKALAASQAPQAQRQNVDTGLAASASSNAEEADDGDSVAEKARERVQKRIQEVQQELRQVQADASLSKEEKAKRVQELQTELMSLMNELQQQEGGSGYTGGTVAQGMAQSLT